MRIGSLFAGVGGLEKGLEDSGLGETMWHVEIEPYCCAVLQRHWTVAKGYEDVRAVGKSTLAPVDLICGGFPCTDVSSAGKRVGLAGTRSGLWYEYLRIISELQPAWVVVENVASGAAKWVDAVQTGLEQRGYASLPVPIAAADLGAPHARQRVFIVATHADSKHIREESRWFRGQDWTIALLDSIHGATGNASANTDASSRRSAGEVFGGWSGPLPEVRRMDDGFPKGLDRPTRRLKALGNAVVPPQAQVIGHVILELMR
jgi:DNA (cytosine-5)-methyltransferase 1